MITSRLNILLYSIFAMSLSNTAPTEAYTKLMYRGDRAEEWTTLNTESKTDIALEVDEASFERAGFQAYKVTTMCVNAFNVIHRLVENNTAKSKAVLQKLKRVKCFYQERKSVCPSRGGQCKVDPPPRAKIEGDALLYPAWEYSTDMHDTNYYSIWRNEQVGGECPLMTRECGFFTVPHDPQRVGMALKLVCEGYDWIEVNRPYGCHADERPKGGPSCEVKVCMSYKRVGKKPRGSGSTMATRSARAASAGKLGTVVAPGSAGIHRVKRPSHRSTSER